MRKIMLAALIVLIGLIAASGTAAAATGSGDPLSALQGLISALEEILATLETLSL